MECVLSLSSASFFIWFVPALLLGYLLLQKWPQYRSFMLIAISSIFITLRTGSGLAVFVAFSVFVFFAADKISKLLKNQQEKQARHLYIASLAICIGSLLLARLFSFSTELSFSYFCFFLLAYLTEVYWQRINCEKSFVPFAASSLSVSYISSGPVPAIPKYLEQINSPTILNDSLLREALFRIFCGICKKTLADFIAIKMAAPIFLNSEDAFFGWLNELLRAARLYCDFSGYTDIAIGVGLMLGHRLPENFKLPFLSTSVSDYWRKWNSSVTFWFLNYVFTPLTLKLRVFAKAHRKLPAVLSTYLTLVIIGLWHGFAWNQIIWASVIATAIVVETSFSFPKILPHRLVLIFSWALTFYITSIARIFSTETVTAEAVSIFRKLHSGLSFNIESIHLTLLLMSFSAIAVPHLLDLLYIKYPSVYQRKSLWVIFIGLFIAISLVLASPRQLFIYEAL